MISVSFCTLSEILPRHVENIYFCIPGVIFCLLFESLLVIFSGRDASAGICHFYITYMEVVMVEKKDFLIASLIVIIVLLIIFR